MSSNKPAKSRFERRAARQRQLDMMEAAASGTSASLELDSNSVDSEGRFVSIRQRNQETARRFLYDEDEALQQTVTTRNTTSAGGFASKVSQTTAVNLMDHQAGVYTQQDNSFFGRTKRFLFGEDHHTNTEHDAIAADTELYLGDQRASRTSSMFGPVCGRMRYLFFKSKQRFLSILVLVFAFFIIGFFTFHALTSTSDLSPEQILRAQNSQRFNDIMDHIVMNGVSDPKHFLASRSPQARALRWIAYSDQARLAHDDPMILQRFSLAVFFYNSFAFYERSTGKQKPIETADDQFEGVPVAGWYVQENWLSKKGFCSWYGVQCEMRTVDGIDMRTYDDNAPIYALNLTSNYVWGSFPFEIKALNSIERLDLSKNRLSGNFPSVVRHLPKLKYIHLTKNRMQGELPPEIGFLQSTVELILSKNKFSGSVPTEINRLSNLRVMDLSENLLNNQFPSIRSLSNLKTLHLESNGFTGTVPFSLAQLIEVREIYIEKNKFGGTIAPEMETLANLMVFSAHENQITGRFPNGLFYLNSNLERVSVNDNKLTGPLPSQAGNMPNLRSIHMQNNMISGAIPTEWTNMPKLEVLHLQNNKLHGPIPPNIGQLKAMKELWLSNNSISGPLPAELGECAALHYAYLDDNRIMGNLPTQLGELKMLHTIRMEGNSITGNVPQEVCNLKSFERLKFLSVDCAVGCTCCDKCF